MSNLFWDSCVFYAHLDSQTTLEVKGIDQYLHEARDGLHQIYASSLMLAEVVPQRYYQARYWHVAEFH